MEYILFDTRNAVDGHPWPDFNLHLIRTFQDRGIYGTDRPSGQGAVRCAGRRGSTPSHAASGAGWQDHSVPGARALPAPWMKVPHSLERGCL